MFFRCDLEQSIVFADTIDIARANDDGNGSHILRCDERVRGEFEELGWCFIPAFSDEQILLSDRNSASYMFDAKHLCDMSP